MIDFTEPFFAKLLERMDRDPFAVESFEAYLANGQPRSTIADNEWRYLTPEQLAFILAHWRMTR